MSVRENSLSGGPSRDTMRQFRVFGAPRPLGNGEARAFGVHATEGEMVLKRAAASDRSRLLHEVWAAEILASSGYLQLARPRQADSGAYLVDDADVSWACFQHVEGAGLSFEHGNAAAKSLAQLHGTSSRLADTKSRVEESFSVAAVASRVPLATFELAVIQEAARRAEAVRPILCSQPRAVVHGDANLNNFVGEPDAIKLIDWEFCRTDIRLFDLCAWPAKWNASSGSYDLAPLERYADFIREYRKNCASSLPMEEAEMPNMAPALMAYWLMVLSDLSARGGIPPRSVIPVLAYFMSWGSNDGRLQ